MPTTPLFKIEHITPGEVQAEVVANQAFNDLEAAISGENTFDAGGTSSITLPDNSAIAMFQEFTGIITADKTVVIPAVSKFYMMTNSTTGDFDLFAGVAGGIQLKLARGVKTWVYCDGVDTFDFRLLLNSRTRTITAADAIELNDHIVFCDTSGGAFTVTLPTPVPIGQTIILVRLGANTLTIDPGTDTINGSSTDRTSTADGAGVELIGNTASNWLGYTKALIANP